MKIKGFEWRFNNMRVGDYGQITIPIRLRVASGGFHQADVIINAESVNTMFRRAIATSKARIHGPVTVTAPVK